MCCVLGDILSFAPRGKPNANISFIFWSNFYLPGQPHPKIEFSFLVKHGFPKISPIIHKQGLRQDSEAATTNNGTNYTRTAIFP